MTGFAITASRIFDGEAFVENAAVMVEGERINALVPRSAVPKDIEIIECGAGILAPGFIDLQVNGGGGALLNDHPTVDTVRQIADSHRRHGTVGLLPTVITDKLEVTLAAIDAVKAARAAGLASVLGIHVEGPFLDVARKGAHDAMFIREMALSDVDMLLSADAGTLLLTLAPNKVPPETIRRLTQGGIIVSLGHSDATCAEAQLGLAAGATCFTHLYNAMSQLAGREPGMVGAALLRKDSYVGLIADGFHVHDDAMKLAISCKGSERCVLVSDAMPSAAGGPDHFELQGRKVLVKNGKLQLHDGTLAGSNLTMDAAVRYCISALGIKPEQALRMASRTPAECIGRGGELGRILPGYFASLVHLDGEFNVTRTWVSGR